MAEFALDQAEGLRRLLNRNFVRVVTFTAGGRGVGKTQAVLNLATALARQGKKVIALDEQAGHGNLADALGLAPHHDLLDAIRHQRPLQDVLLAGPPGLDIVPAAKGVKALEQLAPEEQDWLVRAFQSLSDSVDVVLSDAVAGLSGHALSLTLAAQDVVVVLKPKAAAITDAYALVKRLARDYAVQRFRVLVTQAREAGEGEALYRNFATATRRFLGLVPEFMGEVPADATLPRAARLRQPVVDAFPTSEAAAAFRRLAEAMDAWPQPRDDNDRLDRFMRRLLVKSRLTAQATRP